MSKSKSVFRNVIDSMIESRARQAAREVAYYRHELGINADGTPARR